jgi:hypothetical protein
VCAPPELDTTTPGATSLLVCDGDGGSATGSDFGAPAESAGGPVDPVCGCDDSAAADPESKLGDDSDAGDESGLDAGSDAGDEPESVGSAKAMPAPLVSATPIPSATANAPTRPMCVA